MLHKDGEGDALAAMPKGSGRNDALNRATLKMFRFVATGHLDEHDVRERLFAASETCGLLEDDGAKSVLATIESGAKAGSTPAAQAISAKLISSNACSALGVTACGHAPVLALCQLLIEAGHDPNRPLIAYRGDALALVVRSIAEGAALTVKDDRLGTPRFRRRGAPGVATAPYVAQIRKAGT